MNSLEEYLNKFVSVILTSGRHVVGRLVSMDQLQNIVLSNVNEYKYDTKLGVSEVPVDGLFYVRGSSVCTISNIDNNSNEGVEETTNNRVSIYTEMEMKNTFALPPKNISF